MAEAKTTEQPVKTADHDRVVGLSIRKDGTLDQFEPEIIGPKEAALDVAKEQFRQIAVAAVDAEKRQELGLAPTTEEDTSDAKIDALRAEHQKAEKAAEKKAEQVVNALSK